MLIIAGVSHSITYIYACMHVRVCACVRASVRVCWYVCARVECRNLERESPGSNPLHMMAPLMATRCCYNKTKSL